MMQVLDLIGIIIVGLIGLTITGILNGTLQIRKNKTTLLKYQLKKFWRNLSTMITDYVTLERNLTCIELKDIGSK